MSFEVYLECFEGGKPAGVERSLLRSLFPVVETDLEPDCWQIKYDSENSCHIRITSLESNPAMATFLAVFRPCADVRLWNSLLEIMRSGRVVLYYPGVAHPRVASKEAIGHLPPYIMEAMGQPAVVETTQELMDAIANE